MLPRTADSWDDRYRTGDLPWDSGQAAPELVRRIQTLGRTGGRVLEVGAGTGTNAIWLAEQGFAVTALDLAPGAIERARAKAADAGQQAIRFLVHDWLTHIPVEPGSQDLIFDRGCWHILDAPERATFAERVYEALAPDGLWISLAGNADEENADGGPPRLTAAEVVQAAEPRFELQELLARRFREGAALCWSCLFRRRRDEKPVFQRAN